MPHKSIYLLLCTLLTIVNASNILDKYTKKSDGIYHGRYTRGIHKPEFLVPRHVDSDGVFATYELPKYYNHREINERTKRSSLIEVETVHLMLPLNGVDNHVELIPYHEFISPDLVIETHGPGIEKSLNEGLRVSRAADHQCHYRGHLRGHTNSRAALSLCDGVAGYIQTNEGRYFIEPVEDSDPAEDGQHVHMAYRREAPHEAHEGDVGLKPFCGTSDNWEAAWAEQLAKRQEQLVSRAESQSAKSSLSIGASKRADNTTISGTHSVHRYIELGLICDRRFIDHHKGTDYEKYLMTVMNMVADYWHDASCGNQVDIIVVRIIYLEVEKKEIDLNISPQAEKTLASFAGWAEKMNPKDMSHPNHYDIAVLITRYDICSETANCQLMGLAYVAAACDPSKAACINEDGGLVLGIVVAHEVGHVMGCSHDEVTSSGCPPQDEDKTYFLMSPIVSINTIRWSSCSRKFITSYLESGLGDCLNNNPRNPPDKYKFPNILPGVVYDRDAQCNFDQPAAVNCDMGAETACSVLWCKNSTGGCFSKGSPPVEGTKCAEKKWCIGGKCVAMGSRPTATHGGWGEWGPMSECTRTCGVGVKMSQRECNKPVPANGGRFCIGERKKYITCSTTPCEASKPPFRAVQCAEYNDKAITADKVLHKWSPYISAELDACALYCLSEKNSLMKLNPVVKDGTPCKAGTRNICIAGVCKVVGCDWVIDSDAIEDVCGNCKGDGTHCSPVEGTYTDTGNSGYQKIVTIPRGARSITAMEKSESENMLAIKYEKTNTYCLNAERKEQQDGDYDCAGTIILYSHPSQKKEQLSMRGPIDEELQLQYVFFKPRQNPGVYYKYYVETAGATSYTPKYVWDFTEWGECSAKCGGGTAMSKPSCIEEKNGLVSVEFCQAIPRPDPKSRICNEQPCPSRWRVSQWSKCSACDGKEGKKHRKVYCIKPGPHPGDDDVQTNFESCRGKVPKQEESCTGTRPCKKTCSKKTRNCGENEVDITDPNEHQRMLVQQRRMIDNLVDFGLARYLEKNRHQTASETSKKSLKRDVIDQFQNVLRDWLMMEKDNKKKRTCHKSGGQQVPIVSNTGNERVNKLEVENDSSRKMITIKPGSIVKDVVPLDEIVLYEVPIKEDSIKANISDVAFQEGGDTAPLKVDQQKQKVFHGIEAMNMLLDKSKQNGSNIGVGSSDSSDGTERPSIMRRTSDVQAETDYQTGDE